MPLSKHHSYPSDFSATAKRSASGSVARTIRAFSLSARRRESSYSTEGSGGLLKHFLKITATLGSVSHQNRLSLLWVWTADGGEVGIGVFLLRDGNRWSEAEDLEGLLDKDVSDAMEGRVDELQRTAAVKIPEKHKENIVCGKRSVIPPLRPEHRRHGMVATV